MYKNLSIHKIKPRGLAVFYNGYGWLTAAQNGSMDYPGGKKELEFTYNDWGALVSDPSRGITDISYDNFGNPLSISSSTGESTKNVYSAAGEKLSTVQAVPIYSPTGTVMLRTTTKYHGPVIYRNGSVDMVLFPGGYATVSGSSVTFHYYTQDYLGNNRAVINGSSGEIEQTIAYYPYGGVIADLGTPTTGQPYKFGGKELITACGLNEYDFGARRYYQAIPHFTSIDPMAEKYPWLSPYLYCANNPIMLVDEDGQDPIYDTNGNFLGVDEKGLQGKPIIMESKYFENGMSHDCATRYACNPMNDKIWDKIKRHHTLLRTRPDYDGKVTVAEGIKWAKAHPYALRYPTPDNILYIDTSQLDFGPLSVANFKNINTVESQNLFEKASITFIKALNNSRYRDTVYGLGLCNMKLLDRNKRTVMVINDESTDYDWNGGGSTMRNLSITINNSLFGIDEEIHGFKTFYYGIGILNK